jgi:3-hydroxy acid dehydrogenase / malonic semialdehyde reductase
MDLTRLQNKIVFITGASSGIGAACATQFAAAGAKLILCARNQEKLTAVVNEIKQKYVTDIYAFTLDVRHHAEVQSKIENLPGTWQPIDILINNAGIGLGLEPMQEGNIADWDIMIDTNIKGLLYITRQILPQMIARNAGHIVNIGSVAGHYVYPRGVVYCATKFAVHALNTGLRMDLFGTKIRVTSIDPGAVHTNFSNVRFKGDTNRAEAVYEGMEALTADDIADNVIYCTSRPPHVNISEMIVMPTDQAAVQMIARRKKEDEK